MRHVLPVAVFELDQKARRAVVVDDLALENAVACAARWIERSEELLSLGIVGDARRRASGAPSNFFCTERPMRARSDIWAPLAFARSRGGIVPPWARGKISRDPKRPDAAQGTAVRLRHSSPVPLARGAAAVRPKGAKADSCSVAESFEKPRRNALQKEPTGTA